MYIRPARQEDVPAIARVHIEAWRATYKGMLPEAYLANLSYEAHTAMWQNAFTETSPTFLYVAECDGKIVAFAAAGPVHDDAKAALPRGAVPDAELYAIYTLELYQRQGLGRRLVTAIAEGLIERNYRGMLTWVLEDNASCRFYEAIGGQRVGHKTVKIAGLSLPALAYAWDDLGQIIKPCL